MTEPFDVSDYRELARRRLPRIIFDYLEGGADDEKALLRNRAIFDRLRFKPHRLVDVSKRDLAIELFGVRQAAPLLIAPTGLNGSLWPHGDIALARAAAAAGIPFLLSTASNASIEEVAQASSGDNWFQLYIVERKLAQQMVERAAAAGYSKLVLTTDVGVNGNRERDLRNGFALPLRYTPSLLIDGLTHPRWSLDFVRKGMPQLANFRSAQATDVDSQAAVMNRQMDASFNWSDLAWLRRLWPRELLIKGITTAEDAARSIEEGADGVILSNHGGRQLDDCLSPMQVLVETRARIGQPILIDSGFRRGSDVMKALALGADAVLLGRASLYGLAARGEAGVSHVLELLFAEIDRTLAQIGCRAVSQLSTDYLVEDDRSLLMEPQAPRAPSVRNRRSAIQ
jgi:(S)-mandelate dehydrogenase